MKFTLWLLIFSSFSFYFYGLSCLLAPRMRLEFERYHLSNQRALTGVLQIMGASGLLVGFYSPLIGSLAAGGLCLMMLLGFAVRAKIGDTLMQSLPAVLYAGINLYLFISLFPTNINS